MMIEKGSKELEQERKKENRDGGDGEDKESVG